MYDAGEREWHGRPDIKMVLGEENARWLTTRWATVDWTAPLLEEFDIQETWATGVGEC